MVQASGKVIVFTLDDWLTILSDRSTSPEEKGYWFGRESGNLVKMRFGVAETTGSNVHVSSSEDMNEAIFMHTDWYQGMYCVPYHTHPVEGPSQGDKRSYVNIYRQTQGRMRDFLTIGPRTVELNRVNRVASNRYEIANLNNTRFLKILEFNSPESKMLWEDDKENTYGDFESCYNYVRSAPAGI